MDIEKLIDTLKQHGVSCVRSYGKYCSICDEAATAISTLQAENAQLRVELEYEQEHANAYHEECGQWEAENEKLRAELEQVKQCVCSECKGQAFNYEENREVIEVLSKWCPNCGALMDGKGGKHEAG